MRKLPLDRQMKWWEKCLTLITNVVLNILSMSTLIAVTVLVFLSIYFMFTEDLLKFACSVILILTFVYTNKS